MKVLMINVVYGIKSTGRVCSDLSDELTKRGFIVKVAYGRDIVPEQYKKYAVRVGRTLDVKVHAGLSRITDSAGFHSSWYTKQFIKWIKCYDPDIIHIHNIHGYYINNALLFEFLRGYGKRIIWTLHDCWAFTGHCAFFDSTRCTRWKSGCHDCPNKYGYPKSMLFDRSRQNYVLKKKLFTGIPDLTIVTPSEWLSDIVKQSFLSEYTVKVIHNGINTNVFRPTISDLRDRLNLDDKKVVIGVAAVWDKRKGLRDLLEVGRRLGDEYRLILIGIDDDERRSLHIPDSVITIPRTDSQQNLAKYYSLACAYVTPTYEDNYPSVNLEAIACGTPVITYDTGGSGESARLYGSVVKKGDINGLVSAVKSVGRLKMDDKALEKISMERFIEKSIKLYTLK